MKKWLIAVIAAVLCAVFISGMFIATIINKPSTTSPVLGIGQSAQSEGTQVYDQGTM